MRIQYIHIRKGVGNMSKDMTRIIAFLIVVAFIATSAGVLTIGMLQ